MKKIFSFWKLLVLIVSCAVVFNSCENNDEDLATATKLFRPIVGTFTYSGTSIKMEWDRYEGAKTFQLQLSVDSFVNVLRTEIVDTTEYTFENLDYDTEYQLRIKSIGDNLSSEYFVCKNITTLDYPTKLITPASSDIIDNSVRISWLTTSYDSLLVFSNDTLFKKVVVTDADNYEFQKVITGLKSSSSYVVKAYKAGEYMGKKSVKTVASEVFEGDVVDLRDSTNVYSILSQSFFDKLAIDYPSGVNVILAGGTTYQLSGTLSLSSSINLVTGLSLTGFATIEVSGNFDALGANEIGSLKFEKIIFTDHPDKLRTSSNFGGTYLFNFSDAAAKVGELSFDNCDIRYKRGVVRLKAGAKIDKISINNCVIDSIGGYGVVNFDSDQAIGGDIKITNSTISHAEKFIVASKAPSLNSLTLENVTVCYISKTATTYLFDLDKKTVDGGIVFKNCIFGGVWAGDTVHGIRSASTNITIDKSYKTSDLSWTIDATTLVSKYPIDLVMLNLTTDGIFKMPSTNDYTVTDELLVKKAGDPRWW